ncbi:MAG TPA: DUF2844 domain-containing protein [Terriglobales bacterium]|nr:DUF2844 domain-containing protein [Terriglobales bacterium]
MVNRSGIASILRHPRGCGEKTSRAWFPEAFKRGLQRNQLRGAEAPRFHGGAYFRAFFSCLLLALSLPARAALGGDVSSVQADRASMKGAVHATAAQGYTVHEITGSTGVVVREYASSSGKVFAVGWQGLHPPDMQQILGSYFAQYEQAVAQAHANRFGRHPLMIRTPGLVVEMGGHMRDFVGKAYVPGMLPQGVRAEDLH